MTTTTTRQGMAQRLMTVLSAVFDGDPPVRIHAWDGSAAGPVESPVVVVHTPEALRRLLWRPGELGLARAYVSGDLDVAGELRPALSAVRAAMRRTAKPISPRTLWPLLRAAAPAAGSLVAAPPPPPPEEARLRGSRHSPRRDRAAINHHYDLGNDFYELLLDDTMAYSCGYWTPDVLLGDGAAASRAKLDLLCRKLGLEPGMHLVDIGCGWGSLVMYAAEHYGVHVTGYTISGEQAAYVRERAERAGLSGRVSVRTQDYREVDVTDADAVASIEMGEHVGRARYPEYARVMLNAVRPGGRLVLQQMSRGSRAAGGGAFIDSYIAPDMHMRPLPETLRLIGAAGFEIRDVEAMREHYVHTVDVWARRLEERWADFVAIAGVRTARIWRLYLAGGGLAFEENRMGVDQILAVRPGSDGSSQMPYGRPWSKDGG